MLAGYGRRLWDGNLARADVKAAVSKGRYQRIKSVDCERCDIPWNENDMLDDVVRGFTFMTCVVVTVCRPTSLVRI